MEAFVIEVFPECDKPACMAPGRLRKKWQQGVVRQDVVIASDILRQVIEALEEQNAANWGGVRQELVEVLREEV